MFFSKMKKLSVVFLMVSVFIMLLLFFTSCKNGDVSNNGATNGDVSNSGAANDDVSKPICEITFICDGEEINLYSTVTPLFEATLITPTQEEYKYIKDKYKFNTNEFPEMLQAYSFSIRNLPEFIHIKLSKNSSKSSYIGLTETDVGNWIYLETNGRPQYKMKLIGINYEYVYVDILDHQTLSIKTWEGTTVYTVSRYSITYFDDLK